MVLYGVFVQGSHWLSWVFLRMRMPLPPPVKKPPPVQVDLTGKTGGLTHASDSMGRDCDLPQLVSLFDEKWFEE